MGLRRIRRSFCAACALFALFAFGPGCSAEPQTGTQTGDEGDVAKPGASCSPTCGATQTCCSKQCVDLQSDPKNCGRCGNVCSASERCCRASSGAACTASTAQTSCVAPWAALPAIGF